MSKKIRTRFAPSPTGYLHVGGARTALFNYLYAKSKGGDFVIRVEDTDQERSTAGSEEMILESLDWLGIRADEGPQEGGPFAPYRQSERLDLFNKYKEKLLQEKKAYKCFCSDAELAAKQEQAKRMGLPYVYDGKCRGLSDSEIEERVSKGEPYTVRFLVEPREVVIEDEVQGRVKFDTKLIGDFIIVKSNGFPSYNYAVVVDDHEMQISHIIRGVGHLSNTPRQVLIHEALGFELPVYAHVSEIVGTDKKKLSKRRGATSVLFFKELGYLPEAFLNYMALLGWYPRDSQEFMSLQELERKFDIQHCSKSPSMFDFFLTEKLGEDFDPQAVSKEELQKLINKKSKLNWLNNRHIRSKDEAVIWPLVKSFIEKDGFLSDLLFRDEDRLKKSVASIKAYVQTLSEFVPYLRELFEEKEKIIDNEGQALVSSEEGRHVIQTFCEILQKEKPQEPEAFSAAMKATGKATGAKGRALFMTIRVASTGKMQGLELPALFSILGWEAVVQRIKQLTKLE